MVLRLVFIFYLYVCSGIFLGYLFWLYKFPLPIKIITAFGILLTIIFIITIEYHTICDSNMPINCLYRDNLKVALFDDFLAISLVAFVYVLEVHVGKVVAVGVSALRLLISLVYPTSSGRFHKTRMIILFTSLYFHISIILPGILWIKLLLIIPVVYGLSNLIE